MTSRFEQKKESLTKEMTVLQAAFRLYSEEIGDTYYSRPRSGLHPLWEAREDTTVSHSAREIRDILICCPPERRISKVYYCRQNTHLPESAMPAATERRLAYIDQMYALALQYKTVLLEEFAESESPEPTLEGMLQKRFEYAIGYLEQVDPAIVSREHINFCVDKLKQGDITGLDQYFGAFTVLDDWDRQVVDYKVTQTEFYREYAVTSFWFLIKNTRDALQALSILLKDLNIDKPLNAYLACLNKIILYLDGQKIEGLDYFDLCVLGPENVEFVLAHQIVTVQDEWRSITSCMGKIRASVVLSEPRGRNFYPKFQLFKQIHEIFFKKNLPPDSNAFDVLYKQNNSFQELVYEVNEGVQVL